MEPVNPLLTRGQFLLDYKFHTPADMALFWLVAGPWRRDEPWIENTSHEWQENLDLT